MIARVWYGATSAERADEYVDYLRETGLKDFRATEGNRGAFVLRRMVGDRAEFVVLSLWETMDDVRRFAGSDPDRAVYYPEDEAFLEELTPTLDHYDVEATL
jgi:heme-degrading monooxygenase HmoA